VDPGDQKLRRARAICFSSSRLGEDLHELVHLVPVDVLPPSTAGLPEQKHERFFQPLVVAVAPKQVQKLSPARGLVERLIDPALLDHDAVHPDLATDAHVRPSHVPERWILDMNLDGGLGDEKVARAPGIRISSPRPNVDPLELFGLGPSPGRCDPRYFG
jgi:hypothetical protein